MVRAWHHGWSEHDITLGQGKQSGSENKTRHQAQTSRGTCTEATKCLDKTLPFSGTLTKVNRWLLLISIDIYFMQLKQLWIYLFLWACNERVILYWTQAVSNVRNNFRHSQKTWFVDFQFLQNIIIIMLYSFG